MMPFKTILFATDFSPASQASFVVAAALARDYKARIIAVHVVEPAQVGYTEFAAYTAPEEDRGQAMESLQALKSPSPMVTIEYRLLEGDPATVIVETAAETDADIVVMGTHCRAGLTRLVMGSVAEEVLRQAPCPVLTIRDRIAEKISVSAPAAETISI